MTQVIKNKNMRRRNHLRKHNKIKSPGEIKLKIVNSQNINKMFNGITDRINAASSPKMFGSVYEPL